MNSGPMRKAVACASPGACMQDGLANSCLIETFPCCAALKGRELIHATTPQAKGRVERDLAEALARREERTLSKALTFTAMEAHLSERCAVQNEVLLYDVTSTYFEGLAEGNPQAQRGYSRDHRPDCKQVCIALVVTFDGFPLGYEVFAGNTHNSKTLQTIVATMEARHGVVGRVWISRPRHGQRRESGVAARDRPALHHRRAEVGAEEVRLRACSSRMAGARCAKASRSSSPAIPRPTRP